MLAADAGISYTGAFSVADHPSIEGAKVVTLTSSGTLSVSEDLRLLRLLVVGGGGGGGQGGGGGGQVVDWTPEAPVFLKRDDASQVTVGPGGYRSNQGNPDNRGHNGFSSSFRNTSLSFAVLGGGGGAARNGNDGRWDPTAPAEYGNGGGCAIGSVLSGFPAGAEGCFPGGKATNYGSGATGCGGGGGGAGACIPNANTSRIAGWPGANGLGGGGGGGGRDNGFGAAGGSGSVVIRYLLAPPGTMILVR